MAELAPTASQAPLERAKFLWEMNRGSLSTQQKYVAREELWALNPGKCFVCPVQIRREELHVAVDIDHMLPKGDGRNLLSNMRLAHHSCNARRGRPAKPIALHVHERESETGDGAQEWSSEEGRRSDKMTYRYRQRLYHPENGLFKNVGQIYPLKWLADVLPDLTGIGKSTTYRKYIDEDIAAEYLELKDIDGEAKLERTAKPYPLRKLGMSEN